MVAAMIMMAVGTAMSAIGAHNQAKSQAALYEANAAAASVAAQNVQNKANYDIAQHQNKVRRLIGAQQAVAGAQGFGGDTYDVEFDTRLQSNLDEQVIRYNAELEKNKWYTSAGTNLLSADAAESAGTMNTYSSLFKGAGNTILMYDTWSAKSSTKDAGL